MNKLLNKSKNKQKTVAEKIAENFLHPNESGSDSESGEDATAPRIIDYDDDEYELPQAGTTEFRKRNVKLLSEQNAKYKGKIASRKDFESDNNEQDDDVDDDSQTDSEEDAEEEQDYENSDTSEDEKALRSFNKSLKNSKTIKGNHYDTDSDADHIDDEEAIEEESSESDDDNMVDGSNREEDVEDNDNTEVISKVNHEAEIQKGQSVQNQLRIWERLLEFRINLQKVLNKTNQLPSAEELVELKANNAKYQDIQLACCKQTSQLLQNLLTLQTSLASQFSELDKAMKPSLKRPSPFNNSQEGEPPLKKVSQYLQEGFESFRSYRNSVLLKWDDRTKLLQPGAGSKKRTLTEEYDIIKKIDNALINKSLLKEKSQQLKNNSKELENQEETITRNPNIYDDSDFYHQQLRELIEYKANTSSNMNEVTKQFMELQKLRQKMKKKVDTRASKGRKLRYIVHNKLINFMAPHDNTTWTMESIDELSKSLFV